MSKTPFPIQLLEDKLLCYNYNTIDANYRQQNLDNYIENMYVPNYYKCSKDFTLETRVLFPVDTRKCDKEIYQYRGRNNQHTEIDKRKNNFLIPHCECNTYDNRLVCDGKKCCSKSHQLFMNLTKRNGSCTE